HLLGHFREAAEARATAGKDKAGWHLPRCAGALQLIANERKQLLRTWLDNIGESLRKNRARRTIADAGDFDGGIFGEVFGRGPAGAHFVFWGSGNGGAQANGKIVGEMTAANGNRAGVADAPTAVDKKLGGAAADVQQTAAELALV